MLGRSVGLSNQEIAAMADAVDSPLFDETDRLVIHYAEVLSRENRVSDELYAKLAARFSREELLELCLSVGLSSLVNRVHATFRTDLDSNTRDSIGDVAFCPIGR